MNREEAIRRLEGLTTTEIKELDYSEFSNLIEVLDTEDIIELSTRICYPVFIRLCMGKLKHKIPILLDGAAVVIVDKEGRILLQNRADRNKWGLPGGCQELSEDFKTTIIREIKEETNLDVNIEDLELIDTISGNSRRNIYPNGDVVFNNTTLYCIRNYSGELRWNEESKEMRFFDLDNLPENQNDPDLIDAYKAYKEEI